MLIKLSSPRFVRLLEMERVLYWMSQVNLVLRKDSIFMIFPWETSIGFKTKILKEMVMLLRGLGVLILGRNTYVSFFPSRMIDLELVIGVIREGRQPSSSSWFGYHCSKEQSFLCTPS